MEVFLVYLWLKLDSIGFAFRVVALITCVIGVFLFCCTEGLTSKRTTGQKIANPKYVWWENLSMEDRQKLTGLQYHNPYKHWIDEEVPGNWRRPFWITVAVASISGIFSMLLPSSKEAAVLVGTHYAVKLAESPEGLKVQSLIRKKANEFLDEQLKETVK